MQTGFPLLLSCFALAAAAQTLPDRQQTLTLGQVTISTYNPVTVTGFENSTDIYFVLKNQSSRTLTVQLTSWQEMLAGQPSWVAHFFKFDPGSESPDQTTDFALQPGATRTVKFYLSNDINGGPSPQQVQFPFRFRVAETGDQGTIALTYICDDTLFNAWAAGDPANNAMGTAFIAGRVTDSSGAPIRGAEVTAVRFNERMPARTFTANDGSYRLAVFSIDDVHRLMGPRPFPYHTFNYFLTVEADGNNLGYKDEIAPGAGQTVTVDFILTNGAGVRSDVPNGETVAQTPMYKQVGEIATDALLGYWKMAFAGSGDRVAATIGQHPPTNPVSGQIIGVDLAAKELWRVNAGDECWGFHVSQDGSTVAAGCYDSYTYLISSADGRVLQKLKTGDRPGVPGVQGVRVSPDGKTLLTDGASGAGGFTVLDVGTGRTLWTSHDLGLYGVRWSPDGKRFVTSDAGGTTESFSADGTRLWRNQIGEGALWVEMDGNYNVYAAGKSRDLFAYDKDGASRWSYRLSTTSQEATRGIANDGSFMLLPGMNGHLQAFNAQGTLLWQRFLPGLWPTPGQSPECTFGVGHNSLSMTPAADLIVIGSRCDEVLLYDRNGTLLWRQKNTLRSGFKGDDPLIHGSMTGVNTVDITPDGKYIAAGYADAVIRIFQRDDTAANLPRIYSVNAAGGGSHVTQNTWIEIKGTSLAPPTVPSAGITWSNAPEFASGRMPIQLGGVSVKVNGKPAYMYYVSPAQINVLTPLDDTTGPVPIQVTVGSAFTSFTVQYQRAGLSFLHVGATRYVLAQHADWSLVGPTSMSVPGYPFTPASPGETITVWAVGLGLPVTPLVEGSSSQSGEMPGQVTMDIGGAGAHVTYAGLKSPGLYQINVTVPMTASSGDNGIGLDYGGGSTPAGALIPVQR